MIHINYTVPSALETKLNTYLKMSITKIGTFVTKMGKYPNLKIGFSIAGVEIRPYFPQKPKNTISILATTFMVLAKLSCAYILNFAS